MASDTAQCTTDELLDCLSTAVIPTLSNEVRKQRIDDVKNYLENFYNKQNRHNDVRIALYLDKLDDEIINYVLECLEGIISVMEGSAYIQNIKKLKISIEKAHYDKNKRNAILLKIEEKEKNLHEKVISALTEVEMKINQKNVEIKKQFEHQKFDQIALTTLVFTAFTMVSINATLFAAILSAELSAGKVIGIMSLVNIIMITSIFTIYQIIRKIHGDIGDKELKNTLIIGLIIMMGIALFSLTDVDGITSIIKKIIDTK